MLKDEEHKRNVVLLALQASLAKLIIACAPSLLTYGTAKRHTLQCKTQHGEAVKQKQPTTVRLGPAAAAGLAQRTRGTRKATTPEGVDWKSAPAGAAARHASRVPFTSCEKQPCPSH